MHAARAIDIAMAGKTAQGADQEVTLPELGAASESQATHSGESIDRELSARLKFTSSMCIDIDLFR
jgi:hypothetical protein